MLRQAALRNDNRRAAQYEAVFPAPARLNSNR
jgi:hypothetical protein